MFRRLGHPSLLVALVLVYPTQLVHAQSVETGRHSRPRITRNIDEGERVTLTGNTHRDARTTLLSQRAQTGERRRYLAVCGLQSRLEARGENPWSILGNLFVPR
jgi:hypothetical protein